MDETSQQDKNFKAGEAELPNVSDRPEASRITSADENQDEELLEPIDR